MATDTERYIKAAVRLIEDHGLRNELRRQHSGPDKVQVLFRGRPEIMGQKLEAAWRERLAEADSRAG